MIRNCTLSLALLFLCNLSVFSQNGTPDPAFGTNGFYRANYGTGHLKATEVLRHSNGKIITGGSQFLANSNDNAISCFNADGTMDLSFGYNGMAIVRTSFDNDSVVQMLEMPNQNILVLSAGTGVPYGMEAQLVQLKPNGQVDSSFGTNGIARWSQNSHSLHQTRPQQVILLPDGSIMLSYIATVNNDFPAIVKLNANGTVNSSYGVNGVYVPAHTALAFLLPAEKARMHLNADQSIVAYWINKQSIGSTDNDSLHAERILPNGTRDLSFGINGDGVLRRELPISKYTMDDGATLTDGSILMVLNQQFTGGAINHYYRMLADGSPMSTFGNNGFRNATSIGDYNKIHRITPLANGAAIMCGYLLYGTPGAYENFFHILKVDKEGEDPSFGYGGFMYTGDDGGEEYGGQIAENPDGSFWLVGHSTRSWESNTNFHISLTHLTADGFIGDYGLDNRFNNARHNTEIQSLAIQTDGKIVAGGYAFRSAKRGMLLTRVLTNGSTDLSFGSNGFVHREMGRQEDVTAINILSDGKIFFAGNTFSESFTPGIYFGRYNANGTADNSFGANGISIPAAAAGASLRSVVFLPDGKILTGVNASGQMRLLRFNADGNIDNSFGTNGILNTAFDLEASTLENITMQPDGKILITGTARLGMFSYFGVIRLLANGSLDNSFNGSGIKTFPTFSSNSNTGKFSLVQPDGKIIVAGHSSTPDGTHVTVVRLNSNGDEDYSFGSGGKNYIRINNLSQPNKGLLLPDGKILLAGISLQGSTTAFTLASFNEDGSVNTNFGSGGFYANANGGEAKDVLLLPSSNQLLAGGKVSLNNVTDLAIGRFLYSTNPLPLSWGNFTAEQFNRSVRLKWSTVQEINTYDFVLQHSTDGQQWNTIGQVTAAGNSSGKRAYGFLHHAPVKGNNQYRILQRDIDGKTTYSVIRNVQLAIVNEGLQVFGNLVSTGILYVQAPVNQKGASTIKLINSNGQVILEKQASGKIDEMNISHCSNGVYFVVYGNEVKKIVIRK